MESGGGEVTGVLVGVAAAAAISVTYGAVISPRLALRGQEDRG